MIEDFDRCYRAVRAKDPRFDGWFFVAVTSTGIYCRPSCPAMTPRAANVRFFATAAAAHEGGFRACKRCRPDATPGSPEWDARADAVARAMRMISDGVVDREGVPGLSRRLGYSVRQVERLLLAEVGAGPVALARAQRAHAARLLIETTAIPMTDVAFASGFSSVRQFNDTVRAVFAMTPGELRSRAGSRQTTAVAKGTQTITLRLPFRRPLCPDNLFGHLAATSVPGCEEFKEGWYRRTLRLPRGHGLVALRPAPAHIDCRLTLSDLRDLSAAISRCRRLLDLDSDPMAVDEALSADGLLAPVVHAAPGRRVPRTVDEDEMAVRAVLGQQVSTAAAQALAGRITAACGTRIHDPEGGLTHLFPTTGQICELDPGSIGLPSSRKRTLARLCSELSGGGLRLDPGADRESARLALSEIPGIGPWTLETIAMRALGDPDAFPAGDLGLVRAATAAGLTGESLVERARTWRPWRSYAVQYLWSMLDHPINRLPLSPKTADPLEVA